MKTSMKPGTYTQKSTNFKDFEVDRFVPYMYDPTLYGIVGCGPAALSLISGVNPTEIAKMVDERLSLPPKEIEGFLDVNGFRYSELTLAKVSNVGIDADNCLAEVIKPWHVLLLIQLYHKQTASYSVVWNNLIWHNFQIQPLVALELINRPMIGGWIITHDNWKNKL
jgi:hypothetical protein